MKRHSYLLAFLLAIAVTALAYPAMAFELFPGEAAGMQDFREYVKAFYSFSIAAGILIATILIMIGGMIWVTSAGNPGRIETAKSYIIDSIIGVILLLGAVVILRVINPALVDLPKINPAPLAAIGSCVYTDPKSYTRCESVPEISCKETLKGTWKSTTSCNAVCPLKQPPNPSRPGECGHPEPTDESQSSLDCRPSLSFDTNISESAMVGICQGHCNTNTPTTKACSSLVSDVFKECEINGENIIDETGDQCNFGDPGYQIHFTCACRTRTR